MRGRAVAAEQQKRHPPVDQRTATIDRRSPGHCPNHRLSTHQPVLPDTRRQSAATARTPDRSERTTGSIDRPGKAPGLSVAQSTGQPAEPTAAGARSVEQTAGVLATVARHRRTGRGVASRADEAPGITGRGHRRSAQRPAGRALPPPVAGAYRRRRGGDSQPARHQQPGPAAAPGRGLTRRDTGGSTG
ncbi:hypothetical protein D3C73_927190 [compost metagenome]